tara:strand:+ start:19341 stop:20024 length:684 start_codon:yes stop_codon:yes gene_type:complete
MAFTKYGYDTEKYCFAELIASTFEVDNLDDLHNLRSDLLPPKQLNFDTETKTKFHETFYKRLNDGWPELIGAYELFIKNEVAPRFDNNFVYQAFPTFRVHIPNDQAIHYWHYDSDPDHMHPDWEINFQIAITDMEGTRCTWVESVPGLKDFNPMEMNYGEYTIFNGNKCTHGNKVNQTDKMRISFDFRIIPGNRYNPEYDPGQLTATAKKRFIVGDYYKKFTKEDNG